MFKMTIEVNEDQSDYAVAFSGKIDHLKLLGIIETIKIKIIESVGSGGPDGTNSGTEADNNQGA
jgi:hypothetical protein